MIPPYLVLAFESIRLQVKGTDSSLFLGAYLRLFQESSGTRS